MNSFGGLDYRQKSMAPHVIDVPDIRAITVEDNNGFDYWLEIRNGHRTCLRFPSGDLQGPHLMQMLVEAAVEAGASYE